MNFKRTSLILLLLLILVSVLAINFKIRVNNLIKELTEVQYLLDKKASLEQNDAVKQFDSLIFLGDYAKAHQLSLELQNSPVFATENSLQLRFKMASDLVEINKVNLKKSTKRKVKKSNFNKEIPVNTEFNDSILKEVNTTISLDSTHAKKQSLKSLSKTEKTDSYLTFETTKGTSLHYVGASSDNKANGYGIAILKSGSRYEGYWKDNKRHGKGKFFWNDGEYYEGEYQNDKRSGIGTYYWANGDKYTGEWKDDKRNGKGKFYNKKGKLKASGTWKEDELVKKEK